MNRQFKTFLLLGCFTSSVGIGALAQFGSGKPLPQQQPQRGRPAMVLRVRENTKDDVELRISFDYLTTPETQPKVAGHRFYSYFVPLGEKPFRIGFVPPNDTVQGTILHRKRYVYRNAERDRHENGSITVQQLNGQYLVRGAYSYFGELFIIDELLKEGDELLLYEEAAPDKNNPLSVDK